MFVIVTKFLRNGSTNSYKFFVYVLFFIPLMAKQRLTGQLVFYMKTLKINKQIIKLKIKEQYNSTVRIRGILCSS